MQTLSLTHTVASIRVSIETVQNPTHKSGAVFERQLGLHGARRKIALPWPRMRDGRGQSRAQIQIARRGTHFTAIEGHNLLITGRAGACSHFVATGALPLGNAGTAIQQYTLCLRDLRKGHTSGSNRCAQRVPKQQAMVAGSRPGKQRSEQQYEQQQAYRRP